MTTRPDPLLTVRAVAHRLAVHEYTVRRLIWRGELPAVRVGARVRISVSALTAYVEQRPCDTVTARGGSAMS